MTDQAFGGGRDRFCPPEVFREPANGIPNTRLVPYEDCAHGNTFADRRLHCARGQDRVGAQTDGVGQQGLQLARLVSAPASPVHSSRLT